MTKLEVFDALAYAGVAQQLEVTTATVEVYFDQLKSYDVIDVQLAVRRWVSAYSNPFRRLPTVGEIKEFIARSRPRKPDPELEHDLKVIGLVRIARQNGKSQEEIDRIIDGLANNRI